MSVGMLCTSCAKWENAIKNSRLVISIPELSHDNVPRLSIVSCNLGAISILIWSHGWGFKSETGKHLKKKITNIFPV